MVSKVIFDIENILRNDNLELKSSEKDDKLLVQEYATEISRMAYAVVKSNSKSDISSTQLEGDSISVNTISSDKVKVRLIFKADSEPPELSAEISSEGAVESKILSKIQDIKKRLESKS